MKLRLPLFLAAGAAPVIASAHPGHGDHDFGWDYSSSALHLLMDHGHWVLGVVALGVIVYALRSDRKRQ